MSMPSGRHVVASIQVWHWLQSAVLYRLVCYRKTQDASQLPCSTSLHSCRCSSMLRKWWREDKSKTSMSVNSTDVLNAVVGSKPQALVHLTLCWGARKRFCSLWGVHVCMLLCRQAAKMEKTYHVNDFTPSNKHVKWDHNIYDLLQKLFFITCNSADYWHDIHNLAAKVQQNKEKWQTLTELIKLLIHWGSFPEARIFITTLSPGWFVGYTLFDVPLCLN